MLTFKVASIQAAEKLRLEMLQKAIDGWYTRVALCVQAGGMQFKHRLKCAAICPPLRTGEDAGRKTAPMAEYEDEVFICAQDEYENELTMSTDDEY